MVTGWHIFYSFHSEAISLISRHFDPCDIKIRERAFFLHGVWCFPLCQNDALCSQLCTFHCKQNDHTRSNWNWCDLLIFDEKCHSLSQLVIDVCVCFCLYKSHQQWNKYSVVPYFPTSNKEINLHNFAMQTNLKSKTWLVGDFFLLLSLDLYVLNYDVSRSKRISNKMCRHLSTSYMEFWVRASIRQTHDYTRFCNERMRKLRLNRNKKATTTTNELD